MAESKRFVVDWPLKTISNNLKMILFSITSINCKEFSSNHLSPSFFLNFTTNLGLPTKTLTRFVVLCRVERIVRVIESRFETVSLQGFISSRLVNLSSALVFHF